ncbi:hypothetical protein BaRGS_00036225, partial [Batillaria attramentaria]
MYINSTTNLVRSVCDHGYGPFSAYEADVMFLYVRMDIDWRYEENSNFRIVFSFHETHSVEPKLLPGGKWNCSVPDMLSFRSHFPCDLVADCAGGEDEADCPYTGRCGQGKLTIGNRCYLFVHQSSIQWIEAEIMCRQQGGYLASLNTPREWHDVMQVIQERVFTLTSVTEIQIGFSNAPASIGHMYKNVFLWSDSTIVFYGRYKFKPRLSIGTVRPEGYDKQPALYVDFENTQSSTSHLCELPLMEKKSNRSTIHLAVPTNQTLPLHTPQVVCPDGHVTLTVFACDVQTSCWAREQTDSDSWGVPSNSSCPAPMTSRPPMFACNSGVQHVPYSLVCDHRQDCKDASDEDFCDFAPCGGDTQCGVSKQCVDESDEEGCVSSGPGVLHEVERPTPPAIFYYTPHTEYAQFTADSLTSTDQDQT